MIAYMMADVDVQWRHPASSQTMAWFRNILIWFFLWTNVAPSWYALVMLPMIHPVPFSIKRSRISLRWFSDMERRYTAISSVVDLGTPLDLKYSLTSFHLPHLRWETSGLHLYFLLHRSMMQIFLDNPRSLYAYKLENMSVFRFRPFVIRFRNITYIDRLISNRAKQPTTNSRLGRTTSQNQLW